MSSNLIHGYELADDIMQDNTQRNVVDANDGSIVGNVQIKVYKLSRALAWVTLERFQCIFLARLAFKFHEHVDELNSFIEELFEAMAWFVWNLYDKEDFEDMEITQDICFGLSDIFDFVCFKAHSQLVSSLRDISKYEEVREQDVCNILRWCNENKSAGYVKATEKFDPEVLFPPKRPMHPQYVEGYVDLARKAMFSSYILDPKGLVKQKLRMELYNRNSFCIVDALYIHFWTRVNFQKLEALVPAHPEIETLIEHVHILCYDFVKYRIERLHNCESLVTYPLSGKIFGLWDDEVLEVVKRADLKRRSEGRRFIGTDHLVFYLHQMLLPENANSSKTRGKNSQVLVSSDDEERHKDTVYHLYQKAYEIAKELGHQTIGLEHLFVAITSASDDKQSWKNSVECVRVAKAKRKDKSKPAEGNETIGLEELLADFKSANIDQNSLNDSVERMKIAEETYPFLWSRFFIDFEDDRVIDFVKKIQKRSSPLQDAISDSLFKVYELPYEMSEGEMADSLKTNIEISSKLPDANFAVVMVLAAGICQVIQQIS